MPYRQNHGIEIQSLVGQPILVANRRHLIRILVKNAVFDQLFQPRSQRTARRIAEPAQFFKLASTEVNIANDHERPAIADHGKGLGNLAVEYQLRVNFGLCVVIHIFDSLIMKVTPCKFAKRARQCAETVHALDSLK